MRLTYTTLALAASLLSYASAKFLPKDPCILTTSGGDDAPQFLKAVKACSTVTIPKSTTLNIATRLDMTGLRNKHIVSLVYELWLNVFFILSFVESSRNCQIHP